MAKIKLGTRGSKLALVQTGLVINQIKKIDPNLDVEIVIITTMGDKIKNFETPVFGAHKELFSSEINERLVLHEIDIAMHSVKDLGVHLPEDLVIGAVLEREDPSDAFVSNIANNMQSLPDGSLVGTSSIRRKLFIQTSFPKLKVVPFRGNVDTRLQKLDNKDVDAIVMAVAGLKRLGFDQRFSIIDQEMILPSPGQGAISVVVRGSDRYIVDLLSEISHERTMNEVICERAFVKEFGGNCQTPLAALARIIDEKIKLECAFFNEVETNIKLIRKVVYGNASNPKELGKSGANAIKEQIKHSGIS